MRGTVNFINLTPENESNWDSFCDSNDDAWIYHRTIMMKFYQEYRPELKSQNLSFLVMDSNGKLSALCPLFLETHTSKQGEVKEFSFGGTQLPEPVIANDVSSRSRDELTKFIFSRIDLLAAENFAARVAFTASPLALVSERENASAFNYFLKFGFLDISGQTQIIECRENLDDLKRAMRKGHIADIKEAHKLMEFQVYDENNITLEIFQAYQDLHFKAAGRMTRPQVTFDLMFEMISKGLSFLISAKMEGKFVGFSIFEFYKHRACYSSAANDPEYSKFPISHGIQWEALKWLNQKQTAYYDIGGQHFTSQIHDLTSLKEQNIALFKRGFGGRTIQVFKGEKYYNETFCKRELRERLENYLVQKFSISK
jgi:hypothetical protein